MHRASWTSRPAELPVDSINSRRAVVRLGRDAWEALLRLLHTELTDARISQHLTELGVEAPPRSTLHRFRQEFGVPPSNYRRAMLTVQLAGFIHDSVIAEWVDCDPSEVRSWREARGIPEYSWDSIRERFKPIERVKWAHVDLRRSTNELVAELGCRRQDVCDARRRFGVKGPPVTHRRGVDWDKQGLGTVPDRVIAARVNLGVSTVRAARNSRGIPAYYGVGRPTTFVLDWASIEWAGRTDPEIAKEIGCSRTTVRRNRQRLGLPAVPSGRARLV